MQGIAVALFACLVLLVSARRFALPPIPLYIGAGIALGHAGLGIVAADDISAFLTRIGLLFLLFSMGLQLRPQQILERRSSFAGAGAIDLLLNFPLGLAAALLLGIPMADAFIIAAAFYISSSAMAVASLIENKKLFLREAETVVWLMVFEDIVLVVLMAVFAASGADAVVLLAVSGAAVAVCFLVVHALQDPLKALLSREDEIPLVFAFSSVIVLAYIAELAGIPETLLAIVLGSALSQTAPDILEAHIRPFRDVFLILFFVFFGVTVDFAGTPGLPVLALLALLALASKLISAIIIGRAVHGTPRAGIEIWSHTAARGEFSIALAAIFGSSLVSGTVAALVLATSLAGAFLGKYGTRMLRAGERRSVQRR